MIALRWLAAIVCFASAHLPCAAGEPAYPVRPVRVIVPATAGGATDVQARMFAQILTETMKQPFVVDNRGGGGGVVAAGLVAKSQPDGYTLLMATPFLTLLPALIDKLPYDATRDFVPIALLSKAPYLLVANPGGAATSIKEVVAFAKAKPGSLNLGITSGSGPHLAAAYFASAARITLTFVPYKGAAPALTDVVAGHTDMFFGSVLAALPHVRAGRLRALAVSSVTRSPVLPALPTIAETIVPGYDTGSWFGWMAPAGTPPAIAERLRAELRAAVSAPEISKGMSQEGAIPATESPEQFQKLIAEEIPRWRKIAKDAGLSLQ